MSEMWNLETAQGTHGRAFFAVLLAAGIVAATGSYVAAATLMGSGSLTINVVAGGADVKVEFFSDQAATQPIESVNIPEDSHSIVYAKLTNNTDSKLYDLYVGGGGAHVWMNVYTLDGTPLLLNGESLNTFDLEASGQDDDYIIVKVDIGLLQGESHEGDTLSTTLEVWQE